jgi:adenylate kinase family enzyme
VIQVAGVPGSGSTTIGRQLAKHLGYLCIDLDDLHWISTVPPYQCTRSDPDKKELLQEKIKRSFHRTVLCGSLCVWGEAFLPLLSAYVYLRCEPDIRMARLIDREKKRFKDAIEIGGSLYSTHVSFIQWANEYELRQSAYDPRCLEADWLWAGKLSCPALCIDTGKFSQDQALKTITSFLLHY